MIRPYFRLLSVVALGLVAACTSDNTGKTVDPITAMVEGDPAPECPQVKVMRDAAFITAFRDGPGRDITDIVFEGELVGFDGFCESDGDGGVAAVVMTRMGLSLGPAATERRVVIPYFVALARDKRIVTKQEFTYGVEFPANVNRVSVRDDEVVVTIPKGTAESGADYAIFIGFQLNADQLEYNRNNAR